MTITFEQQVSEALADLDGRLDEGMEFRAVKARELIDVLAEPWRIPERLDHRALALAALVLGGLSERAMEIGAPVVTDAVEDDQLRQVVMIAGLDANRHGMVCAMLDADPAIRTRAPIEMTTATAARLVADERYSEAADWLGLAVDGPFSNALLEPVMRLFRLRLWMECRAKCSMPVLDAATGTIEFPEALRERCVAAIDGECRGLVVLVEGTEYGAPLAVSLIGWMRSLEDQLLADERVPAALLQCAHTLLD